MGLLRRRMRGWWLVKRWTLEWGRRGAIRTHAACGGFGRSGLGSMLSLHPRLGSVFDVRRSALRIGGNCVAGGFIRTQLASVPRSPCGTPNAEHRTGAKHSRLGSAFGVRRSTLRTGGNCIAGGFIRTQCASVPRSPSRDHHAERRTPNAEPGQSIQGWGRYSTFGVSH